MASMVRNPALQLAAAYAALLGCASLGWRWPHGPQQLATLWLPDAILLVAFLHARGRGWIAPALIAAGWFAQASAGLIVGAPPLRAMTFATLNVVVVLTVAWAMRRARIERPNFMRLGDVVRLSLITGVMAPMIAGVMVGAALFGSTHSFDAVAWIARLTAQGLGLTTAVVIAMTVIGGWPDLQRLTARHRRDALLIFGVGLIVTTLVFVEAQVPMLFVLCPFVLIAASRLGVMGVAAATAMIWGIALLSTTIGVGPISWIQIDPAIKSIIVNGFVAINLAIGLCVCAVLADGARTQQELYASRDFARSMLDNMREVIFRTNRDGRWIFLNDAWEELTGYRVIDSLGQPGMQLLDPEDFAGALALYERLVAGEIDESLVEVRFHSADGTCRYVEVSSRALRASDGAFIGTIGNIRDVSERRAAEIALRESERRFQTLAALSPAGIFRTDALGYANYFNAAWSQLTGLTEEATAGGGWLAGLSAEDRSRVAVASAKMLADRQPFRGEFLYTRPDGGQVWIDSINTPEIDERGEIVGHIGIAIDVTERKQLEIDLAAARDSAEISANTKAGFLANMSHEIRTPMNAVIGFIELLLASDLNPDQQRYARLIADSGWAMMRLLNDILDVSKIDAGQMQMIREPVDLRRELSNCVKLMEPIAASKGIILYSDIDDEVPDLVMGDGLRIRQIVLNLVVNALKFTEKGAVTIFAGVLDEAEGGKKLEIEVSDTGVGIPPERQAAVFDQFVQSDDTTAQHFGGTGLGLSISSQLARLMSGDLTLDSTPGAGTSFFLRLPLEAAPPRPEAPALLPAPSAAVQGVRVLVAEDNDVNQLLLTAMLDRFECAVSAVTDGEQAVTAILDAAREGRPFQLVLMDVQMPNLDGMEATRLVRASGITADQLPIVALTANAFADSIEACLEAGMQEHYAKPLTLADLESALARWVPAAEPAMERGAG